MGGIHFAWLAVWFLNLDFFMRLGEVAVPGGGECGSCPDFASYTLAFALQLRKITENLSQGRPGARIGNYTTYLIYGGEISTEFKHSVFHTSITLIYRSV